MYFDACYFYMKIKELIICYMNFICHSEWVVKCPLRDVIVFRFSGITAEMLADVSTTLQEIQVSVRFI
jgi:hypothetical protein